MRIEDKIIEKINNYHIRNRESASVILIHNTTFENLLIEIKERYGFESATLSVQPNIFRYMGLRVCRTIDINPDCIEVY